MSQHKQNDRKEKINKTTAFKGHTFILFLYRVIRTLKVSKLAKSFFYLFIYWLMQANCLPEMGSNTILDSMS